METKKDPYEILTTSRFYLEIALDDSHDLIDGYFAECQGFKRSQEVIEVCEVTPQKWGSANATKGRVNRTKMPGNMKSENIILKRGMTISDSLWKWLKAVEDGNWAKQRRDGDLTIYDQHGDPQARFRFLRGWPTSYKIADVKSDSTDFQIEELELAVEEFLRVQSSGEGT
ncbi:MAG: phage tail protein [Leptolyngbyaceae bacterium]|nr:phage tail protein [Leptolyngbyaceae bacterium]